MNASPETTSTPSTPSRPRNLSIDQASSSDPSLPPTPGSLYKKLGANGTRIQSDTRRRRASRTEEVKYQKKVFERWINAKIFMRHVVVNDLFTDLRTGEVLYHLLDELSAGAIKEVGKLDKGNKRIHHVTNLTVVFKFLSENKIKTVGIGATDIADGNPTLTLGFMWSIMLYYFTRGLDSSGDLSSVREDLMNWMKEHLDHLPDVREALTDLTSSLADGKILLALLNGFAPEKCPYEPTNEPRIDLKLALETAHRLYAVEPLIDPNDDESTGDEKCTIPYLQLLREHITLHMRIAPETDLPEREFEFHVLLKQIRQQEAEAEQERRRLEAERRRLLEEREKQFKESSVNRLERSTSAAPELDELSQVSEVRETYKLREEVRTLQEQLHDYELKEGRRANEYTNDLKAIETKFETEMAQKSEELEVLERTVSSHSELVQKLESTIQEKEQTHQEVVTELELRKAEHERQLEDVKATHTEELSELVKAHEEKLQEVIRATEEQSRSAHEHIVQQVQSQARQEKEELIMNHATALTEVEERHSSQVEMLIQSHEKKLQEVTQTSQTQHESLQSQFQTLQLELESLRVERDTLVKEREQVVQLIESSGLVVEPESEVDAKIPQPQVVSQRIQTLVTQAREANEKVEVLSVAQSKLEDEVKVLGEKLLEQTATTKEWHEVAQRLEETSKQESLQMEEERNRMSKSISSLEESAKRLRGELEKEQQARQEVIEEKTRVEHQLRAAERAVAEQPIGSTGKVVSPATQQLEQLKTVYTSQERSLEASRRQTARLEEQIQKLELALSGAKPAEPAAVERSREAPNSASPRETLESGERDQLVTTVSRLERELDVFLANDRIQNVRKRGSNRSAALPVEAARQQRADDISPDPLLRADGRQGVMVKQARRTNAAKTRALAAVVGGIGLLILYWMSLG